MLSPPIQVTVWPRLTRTVSGSKASSAVLTLGPSDVAVDVRADAALSDDPQAADSSAVDSAAVTSSARAGREEVFTARRSPAGRFRIGSSLMSNVTASGRDCGTNGGHD